MDLLQTKRPRALLIAFCLLVWLPGLFTLPPTDRDESRFAQASKQMIETGDYVRIMNGDEPRNRKPIGIYWLQVPVRRGRRGAAHRHRQPGLALSAALDGRAACWRFLPPMKSAWPWGTAGRHCWRRACWRPASSWWWKPIMAKTDAALLGATTVAMAVLARAYAGLPVRRGLAALFWIAMGVGILLKGPLTPMVAGVAAITLGIVDSRGRWLLVLRPVSGVLLTLLVVLPWFVAIGLATHGAFFTDAVGGDLGRKLASGDDAHGAPPGTHLLLLPLLAFPATLPVLRAIPLAWRERREPVTRFLLAWIVPVLDRVSRPFRPNCRIIRCRSTRRCSCWRRAGG